MSTAPGDIWTTDWPDGAAPPVGFTFVPADSGDWVPGPWPGFETLDLGLGAASDGLLGARRVRVRPGGPAAAIPWHSTDGDFDFRYVLRGTAAGETAAGDRLALEPGAAGTYPARLSHRAAVVSGDFEYVQITVPAEPATSAGLDADTPGGGPGPALTFEGPEEYELGAGPRSYFRYRDLRTAGATARRIHIHVVRATQPGDATGWHYHSMSQWFMIIGGSSVLHVEGSAPREMSALDSMCIGRGTRHDVAPFTGDYAVLEMCVPADYDTVTVPPPHTNPPAEQPGA